jgi:hypothetical protein
MLNIPVCTGNETQNDIEIPPHSGQNGYLLSRTQIMNVGED